MVESNCYHILYMEDDAGLARLLQKRLRRNGYTVDVAENGELGLEMMESFRFDLVITDYEMPLCGGLEVIRRLSEKEGVPPVIMVTGNGNEKVAVEALKLGATDYLVKDVEMNYLELLPLIIEQVLEKQRLIRERQQMFETIRENEERYRKLVELSPEGIAISYGQGIEFINPAGIALLGADNADSLYAREFTEFVHPEHRDFVAEHLASIGQSGPHVPWVEASLVRPDGTQTVVEISGLPFLHNGNRATQILFRDITDRKLAQERLERLAHYDPLTGLPNRTLFFDRLNHAYQFARRHGHVFALLFVDLDRFKQVNDTLGHDVGDLVLKVTAERLKGSIRASDTVARMGGDEFTIILTHISEEPNAAQVAEKIIALVEEPISIKGRFCDVGASIGIALYPRDGGDPEALLKQADSAMYQVKKQGRGSFLFCNP